MKRLNQAVFVAGHNGMVGSAIVRRLHSLGYTNLITCSRSDVDLINQADVNAFFKSVRPAQVYLAAAKVGGIQVNNEYPADFIYENLMIAANIIHAAHENDIDKLLFLGSSCMYPKYAEQPMREDFLLRGLLEPTNEPYAIAKIAGIKLCESYNRQYGRDYRSVIPTNLYGPNDNFHLHNAHVIPALMRRFHEAVMSNTKELTIWGSGTQLREFLHVDDMAAASVRVMNLSKVAYQANTQPMLSHINIGTGVDCTINQLSETMALVTGFKGKLIFDTEKPDGSPRKLLDVSRLKSLGWVASISLEDGLRSTYQWFLNNQKKIRH